MKKDFKLEGNEVGEPYICFYRGKLEGAVERLR